MIGLDQNQVRFKESKRRGEKRKKCIDEAGSETCSGFKYREGCVSHIDGG